MFTTLYFELAHNTAVDFHIIVWLIFSATFSSLSSFLKVNNQDKQHWTKIKERKEGPHNYR